MRMSTMVFGEHVAGFFKRDDPLLLSQDDASDDANLLVGEMCGHMGFGPGAGMSQHLDLEGQILIRSLTHLVTHFQPTILAVGVGEDVDVCCATNQNQAIKLVVEVTSAGTASHGMDAANWSDRIQYFMTTQDERLSVDLHDWSQSLVVARQDGVRFLLRMCRRLHDLSLLFGLMEELEKQNADLATAVFLERFPKSQLR